MRKHKVCREHRQIAPEPPPSRLPTVELRVHYQDYITAITTARLTLNDVSTPHISTEVLHVYSPNVKLKNVDSKEPHQWITVLDGKMKTSIKGTDFSSDLSPPRSGISLLQMTWEEWINSSELGYFAGEKGREKSMPGANRKQWDKIILCLAWSTKTLVRTSLSLQVYSLRSMTTMSRSMDTSHFIDFKVYKTPKAPMETK